VKHVTGEVYPMRRASQGGIVGRDGSLGDRHPPEHAQIRPLDPLEVSNSTLDPLHVVAHCFSTRWLIDTPLPLVGYLCGYYM